MSSNAASRRIAVRLLLLGVVLGGLWWYRFSLLTVLGHALLANTELTDAGFSGLRIGRDTAAADRLHVGFLTAGGPLSAEFDDVRIGYALSPFRLTTIDIAQARLFFTLEPQTHSSDSSAVGQPLDLPLERLTIPQLILAIDTPRGRANFSGKVDMRRAGKGIRAHFDSNTERLTLDATTPLSGADIALDNAQGQRILTLTLDGWQTAAPRARVLGQLSALIDWLGITPWLPTDLRHIVLPPNWATIRPLLAQMTVKLNAGGDGRNGPWHGWLLLAQNDDYVCSADWTADFEREHVGVDAHLDMPASRLLDTVRPWLPEGLAAWHVTQGRIVATSRWQWQGGQATVNTAHIRAYDGMVASAEHRISGLDLNAEFDNILNASGQFAATAEALALGENKRLQDVRLVFKLQEAMLRVEQAQVSLFGGRLSLEPGELDYRRLPLTVNVLVDDLDLSQVLASLNYPPLSGTGRISGKLPLSVSREGFEIHDGLLSGSRPGVLHYLTPENPGDNLAFKALRNLMYHSLQASLDYQPDGAYKLGLRMRGENPNVLSGHPLAFNLNVSGQLPDLIRKGLLTGGFERSVLEQATAQPIEGELSNPIEPRPGALNANPPVPAERRPK